MERAELARLLGASPVVGEGREHVVVEARNSIRFREEFAVAVAEGGIVFLAHPDWGAAERAQFNALVATRSESGGLDCGAGWLCIPTGGSSGRLKLARHDQDTLHAAVRGFAEHFSVSRVNAAGVLPLHHVGGLMGWLRCELTGGTFLDLDWKDLELGATPALPATVEGWFLSLVPTQLQRLLTRPASAAWLRQFRAVLLGGGPLWPDLAETAAEAGVPLAPTYGATETAAAVAALRPEDFLAGVRGCGPALPHAQITVAADGAIGLAGDSLFRGYWPGWRQPGGWATDDRGRFDVRGSLQITGRNDALILTGGEKVDPAEVETALRATGEFDDVAVVGVPDADWGSAVVACYPAGDWRPDLRRVETGLERLAAWKRPKRYMALAEWPRNAAGKMDRKELAHRAAAPGIASTAKGN